MSGTAQRSVDLRHHSGRLWTELSRVGPPLPTRWGAVRVGLTLLLALLPLWALGRIDLSLYATFGTFTGVYGGPARVPGRWRRQVAPGAVLVSAVAVGSLVGTLDARAWWAVLAGASFAALGAGLSDRLGWVPPGPLFAVFAVGACSTVPTDPATVPLAAGVALGAATLALGLGLLEQRLLGPTSTTGPARPSPPTPEVSRRRLRHAARSASAAAAAGLVMTVSGVGHPYWAMVAAVVPFVRPDVHAQVARGLLRVGGTAVGVLVAAGLLALDLPPLGAIVALALLQVAVELVVMRHYGLALVLITPLALQAVALAHPEPVLDLLGARLLETAVGAAIGVLVALATRGRARRG
ncbi:MAG: FUSC family protein [Nocardioides sp.]|nr:FUSC family protein [Nocardioides sp.]